MSQPCPNYGEQHRSYVVRVSSKTIQCMKCMDIFNVPEVVEAGKKAAFADPMNPNKLYTWDVTTATKALGD